MIDEVDLLEILLSDFVWPVENIPSYRGGRSQVKPATAPEFEVVRAILYGETKH